MPTTDPRVPQPPEPAPPDSSQRADEPSLHPVTLSAPESLAPEDGDADGRVVPFPRLVRLDGERWSATLPVAQAARSRWSDASATTHAPDSPPPRASVLEAQAAQTHQDVARMPASPTGGNPVSLETPRVEDLPGVETGAPVADKSSRALVKVEPTAARYRGLTKEEGEHIAWMRTWLDDRLHQPGNALEGLSLEEQIRLAIEARNALLPMLADPIPAEFLPLARAYLFGGGPLDEWLHMTGVTDVTVNGRAGIFIKIGGQWTRVGEGLPNEEILRIVNQMTGKQLTVAEPWIEAQTLDGSRLAAIHGDLAGGQAALALRLFPRHYSLNELVDERQMLTEEAAAFCRDATRGKLGIAVAGGTGTGKTTLLNALLGVISPEERLVIIEDGTRELVCPLPNVLNFQTRRGTLDSKAAGLDATVTASDLLERALWFAPDRIFVGECRGKEAYAWLQTVNTGHPGSMTTLHSDFGALAALSRMQGMVLQAEAGLPAEEIRRRIAEAIQLVLFTAQHQGERYLRQIIQVVPSPDSQYGFSHAVLFEARPEEGRGLSRQEVLDGHLAERMRVWGVRPDTWLALPQTAYR